MRVPVSAAKAQLTDLVRRAEAGDEVILTRHGHSAVQLVPLRPPRTRQSHRALIAAIQASAATRVATGDGTDAARSQDFLYDEDGLPS